MMTRAAAGLIASGLLLSGQQQPPVFRAGVEVVSVDVVVLDKSGAPVPTLTADDFTVVAGRKPRRIVSVEYITSHAPPARHGAAPVAAPSASSNTRQTFSRTLIFVVDVENILSGEGRLAMQGIADFLERLSPDDRVGLVALPSGTPRIDPTTDRAVIRSAVTMLVGTSIRLRDREMTFGEAAMIFGGDRNALAAYWYRIADQGLSPGIDRSCSPPQGPFERPMSVPQVCVQAADRVLERARFHARNVLASLRLLAEAMAPMPGPKAIVLASGGVLTDPQTLQAMNEFSAAAERARVSLYSMLIEAPPVEASAGTGNTTQTKLVDNRVGLAGLSDVALSARGAAQRVLGESTTALSRIDRELSGYYLLSFERDPGDRESARVGIDVRTKRDGLTILARKEFTPAAVPAAPAPADLKAAVGELLKSATPVAQIPLDVDVFALPVAATGDEARAIVAVEIGRAPGDIAALGFQIADASGKVVGDGFESPVNAQRKDAARSIVLPTIALHPGRFIARFGVVDRQGLRGSLQHTFEIAAWPEGPVRLSDLIAGDTATGGFQPAAVAAGTGSVAMRLVVRDSSSAFAGIKVRVEIAGAADGAIVESNDVALQQTPDPLRRFADFELKIGRYPAGGYVVTAIVTANGKEIGRRSRAFRK